MEELSTNLGTVFLARLAVGNVAEVILPILKVKMCSRQGEPFGLWEGPGMTF